MIRPCISIQINIAERLALIYEDRQVLIFEAKFAIQNTLASIRLSAWGCNSFSKIRELENLARSDKINSAIRESVK